MPEMTLSSPPTGCLPCRRELPNRAAGSELLIRNPETDRVHFLNVTATIVWQACDGRTSAEECVERLRARCAVPADVDLLADVRGIVAELAQNNLLEDDSAHA